MVGKIALIGVPLLGFSVFAHRYTEAENTADLEARNRGLSQQVESLTGMVAARDRAFNQRYKDQEAAFAARSQKAKDALRVAFHDRADVVDAAFAPATTQATNH
jgi:hypothetical protein